MYNWKDYRNYRKITQADGSFKYLIRIDGTEYEVDFSVFRAYSKADRKERYFYEHDGKKDVSIEMLMEKHVPAKVIFKDSLESAEETYFLDSLVKKLYDGINELPDIERELIESHYLKGESMRSISRNTGIPATTLRRRRDKILKKLKIFIE